MQSYMEVCMCTFTGRILLRSSSGECFEMEMVSIPVVPACISLQMGKRACCSPVTLSTPLLRRLFLWIQMGYFLHRKFMGNVASQ